MPLSAKMTKIPLANPRFDRRSNEVKTHTKQPFFFFMVLHQTQASRRFLTILTKFDLVWPGVDISRPKNPNFDQAIRMGWN